MEQVKAWIIVSKCNITTSLHQVSHFLGSPVFHLHIYKLFLSGRICFCDYDAFTTCCRGAFCHRVSLNLSPSRQWAAWQRTPWWGGSTGACPASTLAWQLQQPRGRPDTPAPLESAESSWSSSLQTPYGELQKNVPPSSWPCPSMRQGRQRLSHVSRWWR